MEDIIRKIKDLYEAIVKRDADSEAKNLHLTSELSKLESKASAQKAKDIELSNRETEANKKEALISANATLESLKTETVALSEKMTADKKACLEWVANEKVEIAKARKDIDASLIEVKRREDAADAKSKKLDEDRATYKAEIIKEMDKAR